MNNSRARWIWRTSYAAIAILFLGLIARFHHPVFGFTAFFQFDPATNAAAVPAIRERPVYVYPDPGSYDGIYYAQMSCSPLLRDPALRAAMDDFNYRARRILCSWVAWLIGLGDSARALDGYALLNPLCWLILAGLLAVIFPPNSLHNFVAWSGLLYSAGALASVRLALTDLPSLLLITAAVIALERGRPRTGLGLLAAAALARETALSAALAFTGRTLRQTIGRALVVIAPLAAWCVYVRFVAGPSSAGLRNLDWPGVAFVQKWRECVGAFGDPAFPLVPWFMAATLVGLSVQAAWILLRPNWANLWWRIAIGQVALMFCLGPSPWGGYPAAAVRVLLPLQLAFNALVPRSRLGVMLLLLGNLGVVSGLDHLLNVPMERRELAADRIGREALLARVGAGWHDVERNRNRTWCWAEGTAEVELFAWHGVAADKVHVHFALRAFTPRRVRITSGGVVLWENQLDRESARVELSLDPPGPGGTNLIFTTDAPGVAENASPQARRLAYSISEFGFVR